MSGDTEMNVVSAGPSAPEQCDRVVTLEDTLNTDDDASIRVVSLEETLNTDIHCDRVVELGDTLNTDTTDSESSYLSSSNIISISDTESDSDESTASIEIIEEPVDIIDVETDYDVSVISVKSETSSVDLKTTIVPFDLDTTPDFIPVRNYCRDMDLGVRGQLREKRIKKARTAVTPPIMNELGPKKRKRKRANSNQDGQESQVAKAAKLTVNQEGPKKRLTRAARFRKNQEGQMNQLAEARRFRKNRVDQKNQPAEAARLEEENNQVTKAPTRVIQLSYPNILSDSTAESPRSGLRPVVIDGCNVGFEYGNGDFVMRGVLLVIQYFKNRGHKEILCFLPRSFQHRTQSPSEQETVISLEKEQIISYTPSKKYPDGKRVTPYDDRFIVSYAAERQGVIISNDGYRDLAVEEPSWRETIEKRLVDFSTLVTEDKRDLSGQMINLNKDSVIVFLKMIICPLSVINFTFARQMFMLPKDPLGRSGPTLDEMLKFP